MATPFVVDVNLRIQDIIGLGKFKAALAKTGGAVGVGGGSTPGGGKPGTKSGFPVAFGGGAGFSDSVATKTVNNLQKVETAAGKTNFRIQKTGEVLRKSGNAARGFGHSMGLALTRYSAFVAATTIPFAIIAGFKSAAGSVIEFDTALTKMSQILDTSKGALRGIGQEMIQLSVDTGTSLGEIATAGKVLAQAGFLRGGADEFKDFLEPLAKVPLLASFEGIEQATEGVIAAMNQFKNESLSATDVLDKLDFVSNQYATTAADLVQGIKRGGGAFAALGGNLDEFIALFTTMRSVTRESASAIGTSIRTITARMARPRTTKFLEGLGVEIRDAEGELLGVIEILNNLNEVFTKSNKEGKAAIAEKLGGFRQISRVLAAIQNPEKIQAALKSSQEASGSITRNAAKGITSLSAQLNVMGARWTQFIQKLGEPIFIPLIEGATGFLNVVISVLDAMGPLLPLFAKLIGFAGGIAVLAKSLALIPAALNLTSKAFAGAGLLAGLSKMSKGGGAAGAGGAAAGGAFLFAPTKLSKGQKLKGLAGAKIPQLIAATGIYFALDNLGKAAQEAGHETTALGLETTKTVTAMILAASLLSGKSISQLAKGGAAYVGGGLASAAAGGTAGLGAAALGMGAAGVAVLGAASMALAKQVDINIDKLVKKAADHINQLGIEVTDDESLQRAGGEIGRKLHATIQEIGAEFEDTVGFLKQAAIRSRALFKSAFSLIGLAESDFKTAFGGDLVDEDKVREVFSKMLDASPKTFRNMLDVAIQEEGPNFREALAESLSSQLPHGTDPRISQIMRQMVIDFTGGDAAALGKVVRAQELAVHEAFVKETRRLSKELTEIVIPSQIATELDQFQYAIKALTAEVNASTSTFDALSGNIGQISAPRVPTDISEESVRQQLTTSGGLEKLLSMFTTGAFPALGAAGETIAQAGSAVDKLLQALNAAEAAAQTQSDFTNIIQNVSQIGDNIVNEFLASLDNVAPEMRGQLTQLFKGVISEWQNAMEQGLAPDTKNIEKLFSDVFGVLEIPTESLISGIQAGLQSNLELANRRLEASTKGLQIDLVNLDVPEDQLHHMNELLNDVGLAGVKAFGNIKNTATGAGFVDAIDETIGLLGAAEERRTIAYKQIVSGDLNILGEAMATWESAGEEINDLLGIIGQAQNLIAVAQQNLPSLKLDPETQKSESKRLERLSQNISIESQKTQLSAVVEYSGIFKSASLTFDEAVTRFIASIPSLAQALRPGQAPDSLGEGPVVYDPATGKPSRPGDARSSITKDIQDTQALGGSVEATEKEFNEILRSSRTMGQVLRDTLSTFENMGTLAIDTLTFQKTQLSDLNKLAPATQPQREAASEELAGRQLERARGTGNLVNSPENIAANILQLMTRGQEVARSTVQLTEAARLEVEARTNQIDITEGGLQPGQGTTESMAVPITDAAITFIDGVAHMTTTMKDTGAIINQSMDAITSVLSQTQQQPTEASGGGAGGQDQIAASIEELGSRMDMVTEAVNQQTDKQVSAQEKRGDESTIAVEGLPENTEALTTSANTTKEGMIGLGADMDKMSAAIESGVGIDVETMSKIEVDVKGVAEASKEFTKDFEDISTKVVKAELRVVLKRLANAAGNPELARVFESIII